MNSKKLLYLTMAVLFAAALFLIPTAVQAQETAIGANPPTLNQSVPADDQAPPVVKHSTWGAIKALYRGSREHAETVPEAGLRKSGAEPNAVAPTLSGYRMTKASIIYKFYDRAGGDWDYLIKFDIPVSSLPSDRRVWAMAWYGTWYDETSQVQLYEYGSNGNGTYRLQYVFGKGKARAYGIYMHPSNWALYYR